MLGNFGFGFFKYGLDPVQAPSPAPPAYTPPQAVYYDPATRWVLLNPDGSVASMDPVDQEVTLALTNEAGSIPSSPTTGNRYRQRLSRQAQGKKLSIATDETQNALAAPLARGDVVILSVNVVTTGPGRDVVWVNYVNTRNPAYNPNNPALSSKTLKTAVAGGAALNTTG